MIGWDVPAGAVRDAACESGASSWETLDALVAAFEASWTRGERPDLDAYRARLGRDDAAGRLALAALVKFDLHGRFAAGESAEAAEYLGRYPELAGDRERAVSVIYEEFCLREERGDGPTASDYCVRYPAWGDSLASQIGYHRMFSKAAGGPPPHRPRFPQPGETFARAFRLRSVLGRGGAATVYLAEHAELGGRRVALKISAGQGSESRTQGRLDHAHIVPVWSVADDPETGLRGLCMPYRAGLSLDAVLVRLGESPRGAASLWHALDDTESPAGDEAGAVDLPPAAPAEAPGWRGWPERGDFARGVAWLGATIARRPGARPRPRRVAP